MPTAEMEKRINDYAVQVNAVSEKYQLIHATFAIERLLEEKRKEQIEQQVQQLRTEFAKTPDSDKDELQRLQQRFSALKTEAKKVVNIQVEYLAQLQENNSRQTGTKNNTFMIVLPKSMENIRDEDGKIDFERLGSLRRLMAHELAHIVLHSNILFECTTTSAEERESEANLFADRLIKLRQQRNEEIYCDDHYRYI